MISVERMIHFRKVDICLSDISHWLSGLFADGNCTYASDQYIERLHCTFKVMQHSVFSL